MDAMGTMRGLDQIREQEDGVGSSRLMSLALGGGFLVACFLVLRTIGSRRTFGFEALMRWVCG